MEIIYDAAKAEKLLKERNIDLKEIAEMLMKTGPIDELHNPSRPWQRILLVRYGGYIISLPYIRDKDENYVIKTAYRSRKYNRLYGGKHETEI